MKVSRTAAPQALFIWTIGALLMLPCLLTATNAGDSRGSSSTSTNPLPSQEGQPLVVGNMIYFQTSLPAYIYAVNLEDVEHAAWKYSTAADTSSFACCDMANSGLAYGGGKIIANVRDGQVVALDAESGKVLWRAKNSVSQSQAGPNMTSAPLVAHDNVIISVSGDEDGTRGYVTAYDLKSGRLRWRAYSTGPDTETLIDPQKTLNGITQKLIGQDRSPRTCTPNESNLNVDPPWGWSSYDPRLNLLFYSTVTPVTCMPPQTTDEKQWALTMFARNPNTGVAVWERQLIPPGGGDYYSANQNILVDLTSHGARTPALVHFDSNGWTYVLDRRSGQLVGSHTSDSTASWANATSRLDR